MKPIVVAVDMGYGHLRPAHAVAGPLGVDVLHADEEPLCDDRERRHWRGVRAFHEIVSQASQIPVVGRPFRWAMETVTHIAPFESGADQSRPTLSVRWLERQATSGIGRGLVAYVRERGTSLFTTFYSTAVVADRADCPVRCLVTDSDAHRIWVRAHPEKSRAEYFAPSERVKRRLEGYGIRPERVHFTGYALPTSLLGEDMGIATANLEARLARLSGSRSERPPLLTFAVGGAGAQTGIPKRFLPSLRALVEAGRLQIALVAGIRDEVREKLLRFVADAGLAGQVDVVHEPDFQAYLRRFDALMAETDVLWTKPSEVTFFAALGLPLVFAPPVGAQEIANRAWAIERGAARDEGDPSNAADWLEAGLADGSFAAMARAGFERLPRHGTYRILERLDLPSTHV